MAARSYIKVPNSSAPRALTAEDAALRTGRPLTYFRSLMTQLNDTVHDLRTTKEPGARARKYDLDKLDAWIANGMPVPSQQLSLTQPKSTARIIEATAVRNGAKWIVTMDEIDQSTQADDLRSTHRHAHALAVQKTGLAHDEVSVLITAQLPHQVAPRWKEAQKQKESAKAAAALATKLSREVVTDLHALGCTYQDIGELLGMSPQRAQQLGSMSSK